MTYREGRNERHYHHNDTGGASLKEIAAEFGVSKQAISFQTEVALKKLRKKLEAEGKTLEDFLPEQPEGWTYGETVDW